MHNGCHAVLNEQGLDMSAVDSSGTSVHNTGPKEWQVKIGKIPLKA